MIQFCTDGVLVFSILIIMSVVKCETKEVLSYIANNGGKVDIQCPYDSGYEKQEKYLCRGTCPKISFIKDIPVKSGSEPDDRRFNLMDNSTAHIFTVTITDLRPSDEGTYWCGVVTGFLRTDNYREVHLTIKHDNGGLLTAITTTTKITTISSYHYMVNTQTVASSSSPSSPSSSSFCLVSENSDLAPIISLSTVILLLLFGLSLFMYCRQRNKKKNRDSSLIDSNTPQESVENNIYVIQTGYEGTHDVKNHSNCCTCSSCFNGNINLPTNPSETINTVYATVQLPKKSSESDRATYSMAHLPRKHLA